MFFVLSQISPHRNTFHVQFVRINQIYNSGYAQMLVKCPITYFMNIHLVFLELLHADVYNEEYGHFKKILLKEA
jgi:hypothetical protein